ncbi:LLM class flavin-dependent oxidoreductase [Planotetraspora sp. A-T 1434]|uniref:LLM class flavin-dependent oxidoreductase n=1 Tax=Planotetraspora sp. A-T 1434 TaxID=2979219 RepID=UPI0021BE16C0|nr:LLM class flavin-dependent oxidoreductase [Planotetraspora sp. A-T 1434]MCT9933162.1 LLM class flavin-dependent oxidoreductase [Planotetraspora sp. A-T 1434]
MHINVFTQCSPSPQFKGFWRHQADRTATGYRSLTYWVSLARKLELACVDALFFADVHGVYDVYEGSWAPAVRHAVQIPSIDPVLVIPAAAAVTEHLGFAVTYSTTYHPPYECARLFSSLDHLTGGRIAWNIVTSYLSSATLNGLGEYLDHDDRYDRADEYLQVVRALWEDSWDDDAVVRDPDSGTFTDPDRVREIGHKGRWFEVRGPHQCEPSPQRTPVLYQAGASARGLTFAAQHAEVVFLTLPDPAGGAPQVAALRRRAAELGRDPRSIKILQGSMVMVGETRQEARRRAEEYVKLWDGEGQLAKWCGWMDFDLAAFPGETPVSEIASKGSHSFVGFLKRLGPEREWTVDDVRYLVSTARRPRRNSPVTLFGTVEEVADRMEEWQSVAGVDGFNLIPCPTTQGIDDICDLLIPELQRRGLFRTAYDPAQVTLRQRYTSS